MAVGQWQPSTKGATNSNMRPIRLSTMVALPRSARLATWASAWLRDHVTIDDVTRRVRGDDEPHDATEVPGTSDTVALPDMLRLLRNAGAEGFRVTLPVPGDPTSLAGPPTLTEDAIAAGEAVLIDGAPYALVPAVTAFGPPGDQGHFVTWKCHPAAPPRHGPHLPDAEKELSVTLLEAGQTLGDLDVSAWRPEVATLLDDLRSGQMGEPLPRSFPSEAQNTAARSARILAIVDFALNDEGGATTSQAAESRRSALTPLAQAARHALIAACNSLD